VRGECRECRLLCQRGRVMHHRVDAGRCEMRLQLRAFGRQHRKQMVHVARVTFTNRSQGLRQQLTIAAGQRPPPDRPRRQQRQPCAKHRGLQIVETAIYARLDVVSAFTLSAVAELANTRRDRVIAGDDRPTVTNAPEILRRIEAECRGFRPRADRDPAFRGQVCLTTIFNDSEGVTTGDAANCVHVSRLSI
jgi:hypothetical protein